VGSVAVSEPRVVWSGKPYLKKTVVKFLVVFPLVTLFLVAPYLAFMATLLRGLGFWQALAAWVVLGLLGFAIYYYNKRAYTYYITDRSVRIEKHWVFGSYARELTFDQIRDIHVQQGVLARAFKCGSVVFVTTAGLEVGYTVVGSAGGGWVGTTGGGVAGGTWVGGGGGVATPHLIRGRGNTFWDVRDPHRVRELLFSKLAEWREVVQQQRMASALERIAGLQSPGHSVAEELERLKRLLDQGAITREEYEELKKKVLGQK